MRSIFRKLDRGQQLNSEEYALLMNHLEDMGSRSPQSYLHFYYQYADILAKDYATCLPMFWYGFDDLLNFLIAKGDSACQLLEGKTGWSDFPGELHPYLKYTFNKEKGSIFLKQLLAWISKQNKTLTELPHAREGSAVVIYEDGNPYKELGLKSHFDRLSRYLFISRLQTYRYLTRNKAHSDKFEVVAADKLGGIFTNKEKSLYYFIYLTENDPRKAENACQVLNIAFKGFIAVQESI